VESTTCFDFAEAFEARLVLQETSMNVSWKQRRAVTSPEAFAARLVLQGNVDERFLEATTRGHFAGGVRGTVSA
jgi:hypothetical protein